MRRIARPKIERHPRSITCPEALGANETRRALWPAPRDTTMLIRLLLVAVVLAGLGLAALGQQTLPAADVPDYVLYDSLFFRVTWLEALADKLASEGKAHLAIRTAIRRELSLNPSEESALKEIAQAWRAKNDALLASARAATAAGTAGANSTEVRGLMEKRIQTVRDHIAHLQASFGAARFEKIDADVRRTSAVRAADTARPKGAVQ